MHPMPSNQTPFGPKFIYHLVVKFGRWVTMNKITQIKRKNYQNIFKWKFSQLSEDKHDVITMYVLCVVNIGCQEHETIQETFRNLIFKL